MYLGQNIRQNPPEALGVVAIDEVVSMIRDPAHALATQTARLRKVKQLDKAAYATAKLSLPYIVGSSFREGIRHHDYFEEVRYLGLDFDDCFATEATRRQLWERIRQRDEVLLAFTSPSNTGLKVWCQLATPCDYPDWFRDFYRHYATAFAEAVGLTGKVDLRTCDVTRACFLAHDPEVYYNPRVQPLDWEAWLQAHNTAYEPAPVVLTAPVRALTPEVYQDLRKLTNPNAPTRAPKRPPFVPEILHQLPAQLQPLLESQGITLTQYLPIQFGLQLQAKKDLCRAEVNVFYGKKGFSVVKTTKSGMDAVLMQQLYDVVYTLLFQPELPLDSF